MLFKSKSGDFQGSNHPRYLKATQVSPVTCAQLAPEVSEEVDLSHASLSHTHTHFHTVSPHRWDTVLRRERETQIWYKKKKFLCQNSKWAPIIMSGFHKHLQCIKCYLSNRCYFQNLLKRIRSYSDDSSSEEQADISNGSLEDDWLHLQLHFTTSFIIRASARCQSWLTCLRIVKWRQACLDQVQV